VTSPMTVAKHLSRRNRFSSADPDGRNPDREKGYASLAFHWRWGLRMTLRIPHNGPYLRCVLPPRRNRRSDDCVYRRAGNLLGMVEGIVLVLRGSWCTSRMAGRYCEKTCTIVIL
jgi:hypothetical protein